MQEDDYDGFDFGYDFDHQRTLQSNVQRTAQNLKVTVVPDIRLNAGLNGTAFESTLPVDVQQWFDQLKETWKRCMFHLFVHIVDIFFYDKH